jgi:hypothetical protein
MAVLFCEFLGFPAGIRNFEGLDPLYGTGCGTCVDLHIRTGLAGGRKSRLAYFWNAEAL